MQHLTDIFITGTDYESQAFSENLQEQLTQKGLKVHHVDDKKITPQKSELEIIHSNCILFIVSSQSLQSKQIRKQLEIALQMEKKVIPILHAKIDKDALNQAFPEFQKIAPIQLQTETEINQFIQDFIKNQEMLKVHTSVLIKALEWEKSGQKSTLLLSKRDRKSYFEKISQTSKTENPVIRFTNLQKLYLLESRKANYKGKGGKLDEIKDIFISYGRKESLEFCWKLFMRLTDAGYNVWFDQNDIPLGVDFQSQIDNGIEKARNFIFVIAPHALKSVYCLKEVKLAVKRQKRIIPILHIEPTDNETWDKMHPTIGRLNWIYLREKQDDNIPLSQWKSLDDFDTGFTGLDKLLKSHTEYVDLHTQILDKALKWEKNQKSNDLLLRGQDLKDARDWLETDFLVSQPPCFPSGLHSEFVCEGIKEADDMITDVFMCYDEKHRPQMFRIREALMQHGITTWVDQRDITKGTQFEDAIQQGLERTDNLLYLITPESQKSIYCQQEIDISLKLNKRIVPLLIEEVPDDEIREEIRYFQYVDFTDNVDKLAEELSKNEKSDFDKDIDAIIAQLRQNKEYHRTHTRLLNQALDWQKAGEKKEFLLNEHQIQHARSWLFEGKERKHYLPLNIHNQFITRSLSFIEGTYSSLLRQIEEKVEEWQQAQFPDDLLLPLRECNRAEFLKHQAEKNSSARLSDMAQDFLFTSRRRNPKPKYKDVFISYGRGESKAFATKLHDRLRSEGLEVWFDQNDIPLGVDFQDQIDDGIEKADNFIFIIAPHSIKSIYCLKEVELALKRNKRIIPILHIEPTDKETWDKMHPTIGKLNWIYMREKFDGNIPQEDFKLLDDFEIGAKGLITLIQSHQAYVRNHTQFLDSSLKWERSGHLAENLLPPEQTQNAISWLGTEFESGQQAPCFPSDLHYRFLLESRKATYKGKGGKLDEGKDIFISYGRKESLEFCWKLFMRLTDEGFNVWFDQVDIPLGVDFQDQIDEGIEKGKNFIFVIAPHALKSPYCLKEIELAVKRQKRIIPILHIEPTDNETWNKMHPTVGKLNWIYLRENQDDNKPLYQWESQDDFNAGFKGLTTLLRSHQEYVATHTQILIQALEWEKKQKTDDFLLKGDELRKAKAWLETEFKDTQPPCFPSDLHAEFIAEGEKLANGDLTDAFMCYDESHRSEMELVRMALMKQGITTWTDQHDIKKGEQFEQAIYQGLEKTDNLLFFITPESIKSKYCLEELEYITKLNKRVITLQIKETPDADLPEAIQKTQYIDFTDNDETKETSRNEKSDFEKDIDDILTRLKKDQSYLREHNRFFNKARDWKKTGKKLELLFTESQIGAVQDWLTKGKKRKEFQPVALHEEFIDESIKVFENRYQTEHQIWLEKAQEWKNNENDTELLLDERECNKAEFWLKRAEKSSPIQPTELQRKFITVSREHTPKSKFKDVFISYGRAESKGFATKLHDRLRMQGYDVWFDQNDIPLGVDFQDQIDDGITKAHNFIFVIAPHAVKSPYCRKEIELAVKLNKRIIPLLQIEPTDCWDKMHPTIGKLNWIYVREKYDPNLPHEEFKQLDDFETGFEGLLTLITQEEEYVQNHTQVLNWALEWEEKKKTNEFLLVGKERQIAEAWLLREFKDTQPPCNPTNLQSEYICEARKNAENRMTDIFISYSTENKDTKNLIANALARFCITTWVHNRDIAKGVDFEEAIYRGVDEADNFLYLISKEAIESEWCEKELKHAIARSKRVIPIKIEKVPEKDLPPQIATLQYIDFTNNETPEDFIKDIGDISREINEERRYFQQHKVFLSQALRWERQGKNESILLRGFNLQNAQAWLSIGNKRDAYRPLPIHEEFIAESVAISGEQNLEVFVSYSRKDSDFARRLNQELQMNGKTTWFDQDSIADGSDFQEEIYKGIEGSDNFLFVISPDAINSPYCADEVEYAANLNKRFLTVNYRPVDPSTMPVALSAVQWIDFQGDFHTAFSQLIRSLDIDRDHVQAHNKWQRKALDWQQRDNDESLLLRGKEFEQADEWFKGTIEKNKRPAPTEVQVEFIEESRKTLATEKRKRQIFNLLLRGLFVISILAGIGAIFFAINANNAAEEAEREKVKAQSAEKRALTEKTKADSARVLAEHAEKVAKKAEKQALHEKKKADEAREKAVVAMKKAEIEKERAERQKKLANAAKEQANSEKRKAEVSEKNAKRSAKEAKKAKNRAEKSEKNAKFNLYWFNAKNFALKSDLHENPNEKAWLSLASYDLSRAGYKMDNSLPKYTPEILQALQNSALAYDEDLEKGVLLPHKSEIRTIYADTDKQGEILYFDGKNNKIVVAELDAGNALNEEKLIPKNQYEVKTNAPVRTICKTESSIFYGTSSGELFSNKQHNKIHSFDEPVRGIQAFPNHNLVVAFSKNMLIFRNNKNINTLKSVQKINKTTIIDNKDLIIVDDSGRVSYIHLEGQYEDKEVKEIFKHKYPIKSVTYNESRKILAVGDTRGNLQLVQLKTGKVYQAVRKQYLPRKHGGYVVELAFSPDGRFMASAGLDGVVMLWDLDEMQNDLEGIFKLVPVIIHHEEKIFAVAFDKDSQFLMYGGQQQLHLRPIKIDTIYDRLRNYMKNKNLFTETHADNLWKYYNKGLTEDAKPHPEK